MIQWFRSFQWSSWLLLFLLALLMRSWFFVDATAWELEPLASNVLGEWLSIESASWRSFAWLLGGILVSSLGFLGAYTLYHYRLALAGTIPALLTVLIGSSAAWWLGYSPMLLGGLLLALAAHRMYQVYRYQGQALPVFDAALLVGLAVLISGSFLVMAPWLVFVLAQFRRVKGSDLMSIAIGVFLPAALVWVGQYYWYGSLAFWPLLTSGLGHLPTIESLYANWQWLAILLACSGACLGAYTQLSTRRPIQEQRAHRMWYTMLIFGWIALLFGETLSPWSMIHVLYPLAMLLGIWLSERSSRIGNTILALLIAGILAGLLVEGFGESLGLP